MTTQEPFKATSSPHSQLILAFGLRSNHVSALALLLYSSLLALLALPSVAHPHQLVGFARRHFTCLLQLFQHIEFSYLTERGFAYGSASLPLTRDVFFPQGHWKFPRPGPKKRSVLYRKFRVSWVASALSNFTSACGLSGAFNLKGYRQAKLT